MPVKSRFIDPLKVTSGVRNTTGTQSLSMWGADIVPPLKQIKVYPKDHEHIQKTLNLIQSEFYDRAKAAGLPIVKRRQYRNTPGFAEAIEYFFMGIPMSEYVSILIERAASKIIQRKGGKI